MFDQKMIRWTDFVYKNNNSKGQNCWWFQFIIFNL